MPAIIRKLDIRKANKSRMRFPTVSRNYIERDKRNMFSSYLHDQLRKPFNLSRRNYTQQNVVVSQAIWSPANAVLLRL